MKAAEYPRARCKEAVWTEAGAYSCELADWHPGPHGNFSSPLSVELRDRWEQENPDWEKNIGQMDVIVDNKGNQIT